MWSIVKFCHSQCGASVHMTCALLHSLLWASSASLCLLSSAAILSALTQLSAWWNTKVWTRWLDSSWFSKSSAKCRLRASSRFLSSSRALSCRACSAGSVGRRVSFASAWCRRQAIQVSTTKRFQKTCQQSNRRTSDKWGKLRLGHRNQYASVHERRGTPSGTLLVANEFWNRDTHISSRWTLDVERSVFGVRHCPSGATLLPVAVATGGVSGAGAGGAAGAAGAGAACTWGQVAHRDQRNSKTVN